MCTDLLLAIYEGGVIVTKYNVFPVIDLSATGRMIEQRRKAAGLSVRDVQTYFGFEYPQAVYKWQHGECLPSVDNLLALSRLLQVAMEDLLVYEDQEVPYVLGPNAFFLFGIKKASVTSGRLISRSLKQSVFRHE